MRSEKNGRKLFGMKYRASVSATDMIWSRRFVKKWVMDLNDGMNESSMNQLRKVDFSFISLLILRRTIQRHES